MKMEFRYLVFWQFHGRQTGRRWVIKLNVALEIAHQAVFEADALSHAAAVHKALRPKPIRAKGPVTSGALVPERRQPKTSPQQQATNNQVPDIKHAPPETGVRRRGPGKRGRFR